MDCAEEVLDVPENDKSNRKLDGFFRLGLYTVFVCLSAELLIMVQISNMLYMVYAGAEPEITFCGGRNFTALGGHKESCRVFNEQRRSCKPELDIQFYSVNSEWQYLCDSAREVKRSISWQMLAVIPGSITFGQLSDLCGRRKVMLFALVGCMVGSLATSFSHDLLWFSIYRSVTQFFNGGIMAVQMVYTMENLPKDHRFWLMNVITWSPNMILLAVIAFYSENWRILSRFMGFLVIPTWLSLLFLSESPRFFIQKRRLEEAKNVLRRISKIDGQVVKEADLQGIIDAEMAAVLQEQQKKKKYSFIHLFYTTDLARYTISLAFTLMCTSMLNYSLLFNMEKLSGSIYMNNIYMGLFRYGVNFVAIIADKRYHFLGRKTIHTISEGTAVFGLIALVAIFWGNYQLTFKLAVTIIIIVVMGMTTLMYITAGMLQNELFPTGVRNLAFSFGQVFSRLGVVIAPQTFFLADIWTPLPYVAMLGITILDMAVFHFNTEETKGQPMRDQMPGKHERWFGGKKNAVELADLQPADDPA